MSLTHLERPEAEAIHARRRLQRDVVRLHACGSVGDGKRTLIGQLLVESKTAVDDPTAALERDPKLAGAGALDLAALLDGLGAKREQGIAIDVGYRCFSTSKRNFIVADTSGHHRDTRNVVAGASMADVSLLLLDAAQGVLPATRRRSFLVHLLGVRHVVLAVNKMDLVAYGRDTFERIERAYAELALTLGIGAVTCIPLCALNGDNVVQRSRAMPWYQGPTLLELLDNLELGTSRLASQPLRLAVRWVDQSSSDFRGFAGTIVAGTVKPGDSVRVQPSGRVSQVSRIVTRDGDLLKAVAGQTVALSLTDEVDVSRGDLVSAADAPADVANQFEATIVWMSQEPLLRGRTYVLRIGAKAVEATISPVKHKVDVETLQRVATSKLELDEIGLCNLELDRPLAFDAYQENRDTGGFILVDRISHDTVGAGMLHFALRRAQNVHWQALDVDKAARAALKNQKPCLLWYTGLSGAGKSTIANLVDKKLYARMRHTYLLDGDNVRHGLNKDLGFTAADRVENIRRIAEVAKLMVDSGLIVSTAFISPFQSERRMARALLAPDEFLEIFVDTPLPVAEGRDPKGLYKKARRGELKNFTGIDSPYEAPENPELRIDTTALTPEAAADAVIALLERRGMLEP